MMGNGNSNSMHNGNNNMLNGGANGVGNMPGQGYLNNMGGMQGNPLGDLTNYEESVRRLENTADSLTQKNILRKCSQKGAKVDVRLFVG